MAQSLHDFNPEFELFAHESTPGARGATWPAHDESLADSVAEMELSADLLEVSSADELDGFLTRLLSAMDVRVPGFSISVNGRALKHLLAQAARRTLPRFAPPSTSAAANTVDQTGHSRMTGALLGLELEGLSPEDQEFEVARGLVRLARQAMSNVLRLDTARPSSPVAAAAFGEAAKQFAPGLREDTNRALNPGANAVRCSHSIGHWSRTGRRIVIANC